jgi:hypothetical protein
MTRAFLLMLVACAAVVLAAPGSSFQGWTFDPDTISTSNQILYNNGYAYVATSYSIYCINATNGWQVWNASMGLYTFYYMQVKGSLLYFGNAQYIGARNLVSGALAWNISANTSSSWSQSNMPLWINDQWFYAFVSDTSATRIVKINGLTGAINDFYTCDYTYSYAQLVDGNILLINYYNMLMVNNSGTQAWKNSLSYSNYLMPVVAGDLIFTASSSYIYAYNKSNQGAQVWRTDSSFSGTPRFMTAVMNATGTNVILVSGSYIYNYDATHGGMNANQQLTNQNTLYVPTFDATTNRLYVSDNWGRIGGINVVTMTWLFQNPTMGSQNDAPDVMQVWNGTVYVGMNSYYSTAITIDGATGNVLTSTRLGYNVRGFVWDPVDFGGALLVLQSYGRVTVLLSAKNATSAGFTFSAGSPDTPIATWNGVAYWGAGSQVFAVAANGSSIFNTTVTGSFGSWKSIAPVFANNNVYLIEDSSSVENIWVFNAITGTQVTMIDMGTSVTGKCEAPTYVDFDYAPVVDKDSLFFSASASRIWMLKPDATATTTGGLTLMCYTTTTTVNIQVTTSMLFVYGVDIGQTMYAISKLAWTKLWSSTPGTGASDIEDRYTRTGIVYGVESQDLYPIDYFGNVFCYAASAGNKLWRNSFDGSSNDMDLVYEYYGYIYAQNDNGKVGQYTEGYLLSEITRGGVKKNFVQNLPGTSSLGYPTISPDGLLVWANYYGVFAMWYNGTSAWNNTMLGSCSSTNIANYMGVVYVKCSSTVYLLDLYSGRTWLKTQSSIDSFAPINNTVLMFSSGALTVQSTGNSMLYSAAQMAEQHPPLPPRKLSALDLLEKSKVWIAGVVVALVVIIVIVLVVKKCSGGGKKDTDYVAMQNPVNNGGGV